MNSKLPNVIVVGGGVAGLMAAISAVQSKAHVTLITNTFARRSLSSVVNEGMNAAINEFFPDTAELHAKDTLACGAGIASETSVLKMCERAPAILDYFDRLGVLWPRTKEGRLKVHHRGGSAFPRTAGLEINIGRHILSALDSQIRRLAAADKITLMEGWQFLSPAVDDVGACHGAIAINLKNLELKAIPASAVVICTGGFTGIFGPASTSPRATGSALIACKKAGAHLANLEFVEVSPFAIPLPFCRKPVSDLIFKKGGMAFISVDGKRSHLIEELHGAAEIYYTKSAVTRTLAKELGAKPLEFGQLLLDLEAVEPEWLGLNFGREIEMYERAWNESLVDAPMKLMPAAARTLGGFLVEEDHSTNLKGLFAAGQCAAAYHGAEALPGNELLASAYGGLVAGGAAAKYAEGSGHFVSQTVLEQAYTRENNENSKFASREGDENIWQISNELSQTISDAALISKSERSLKLALDKIDELSKRSEKAPVLDRAEWANPEIIETRKVEAAILIAKEFIKASLARKESLGAHIRSV